MSTAAIETQKVLQDYHIMSRMLLIPPFTEAQMDVTRLQGLLQVSRNPSEQEPTTNFDLAELYAEQHVSYSPYNKTSPAGSAVTAHNWYSAYVNFHSASFRRTADEPTTPSSLEDTTSKLSNLELWNKRQYPPALVHDLVQVYMDEFHTLCPILDKHHFLATLRNGTVSSTLMSCVLFIATVHCDAATITTRMGFADRVEACDAHFSDACAAFDADREMPRPTLIVCAFLLHYWFGRPSMYRDAAWWLGTAIRTAQSLRYHRTDGTEDSTDNSAQRRVWWCLYIRDRQVSLSMGSPLIINDLDCDVELPRPQDFNDDESTTARYIRLQAELNRTTSLLFYRHCSPTRLRLVKDPEHRLRAGHVGTVYTVLASSSKSAMNTIPSLSYSAYEDIVPIQANAWL
ncbi:hypothetical protein M409DRAFT_21273 [Zasmidium cellare ATCC 36951]|uniref:Xylanolytic transcriptional activator regulatory domain-containing protein n=1 Tax=Zasmidium cellare ATCC 36951 TaxID=1080233 RepID=A0A6A6CPC6_ZASCE|nr:uncharacterized protein M409DRAFT_21273 [Zasmidium cellare ATCC 36951]KAF2168523.1 hypothetical protein M409DRAFT_21273 [Zasmidium cellare ATCC 36951]